MRDEGLGGNGRFDHETVGTAKLFHVEQFEIGRNDEGFRCFLTAKKTVEAVAFYGATDGDYGGFSP